MGINEILGRISKKKSDDYVKRIIGTCTRTAADVLDGKREVYLRQKYQSKARFMQCPGCKLIDCVFRESAKDKFPENTKCPRCGKKQERLMK